MAADVALNLELAAPLSVQPVVRSRPTCWSCQLFRAGVDPQSTKMLQELGGATVIGPLLVGLDRPVQIVQLGAKDNQIVNMAALAAYNVSG